MSSALFTVGKYLYQCLQVIFYCFPLTVNRIPQECDKTMCILENDHEIYKLFGKKSKKNYIFCIYKRT